MSRDIWLSNVGWYWKSIEVAGAVEHSTMHQTATYNKELPISKMYVEPILRNPAPRYKPDC